jgi:glycosyltransferase involved in cell wall biosynthesis
MRGGFMKISVIVPIYNAEKYLRQTLDSIRFQTYKDLEIICVLDCPADNSAKIVEDIAKVDNRIKPVFNTRNMGLPKARNIGVENASGEYIHFIDSDDFINLCFYEVMITAAVRDEADVAACSVFYEKKPKQSIWFGENEIAFGQDKINKTKVLFAGWAWRYLIKKSFWLSRNLSFPDLAPMEDSPVIIPMVWNANKIALCCDAVYYYKNRENSILTGERCGANAEKKKLWESNRLKARKIFIKFMRSNKIKHPNLLRRRYIKWRTKKMICVNAPIEYGKIDAKISVIVPIYNAEKHLKQTLDSIRFQTYRNLEIVCVLDCPTDNSTEIVENIMKEDERIKTVYNKRNMGLPKARNTGVENASGEYIHFMDADDLLTPDFYEVMMSAAVRDDADAAACSVFYEKKPWRSIWFRNSEALTDVNDKMEKTAVTIHGWAWRYLIRKSFWTSSNLSFPDLVPMEDKPAMIPMIFYANKVVTCPGAVYFYKNRESSILNRKYDAVTERQRSGSRQKARKIFKDFMSANKIKKPSRLLYSIKRALFP